MGGFHGERDMNIKNLDAEAKLRKAREAVCKSAEVLAAESLDKNALEALYELVRRMRWEVDRLYFEVAAAIYLKTGVMPHEDPETDD